MKNKNKFLDIIKIITLALLSILILIMIIDKVIPESKKDKTDTYLSWCKSAYDNPKKPNSDWHKEDLIKCVKGWKKIEKEVK